MQVLLNIIAILPGLIICWYIYRLDKHEKESKAQLILCFILGMLATVPAYYLQRSMHDVDAYISGDLALLLSSFLVVGFGEELSKFIAFLFYPYQRSFFNEPFDGIIYAVMISMGFATLENLLYANRYGLETTLLRAFTAVPAHAAFAVIVGYYAGLAKFVQGRRAASLLGKGLGIAILIHGLYDFFILQEYIEWLILLAVIVLWLSLWYANRLIKLHQHNSPFRETADEPEGEEM